MLRLLVLILILANGVYFAWSDGLLRAYGFAPAQQREPLRVAQQLQPQAIQILTPEEFKRVEGLAQADQAPRECLQAGPFDEAQSNSLRRALESSLATGTWQMDAVDVPARWIVYMGKFADAEALAKKRNELAAMKVVPVSLNNPALELGLSLAGFDTQEQATAELARLSQRGIRTAKVVQERVASKQSQLKIPVVTSEVKSHLGELKSALGNRSLHSCN